MKRETRNTNEHATTLAPALSRTTALLRPTDLYLKDFTPSRARPLSSSLYSI